MRKYRNYLLDMLSSAGCKIHCFCLIQAVERLVHYLELMVGEDYWQCHPELRQIVDDVLDSFRVNPTIPSTKRYAESCLCL